MEIRISRKPEKVGNWNKQEVKKSRIPDKVGNLKKYKIGENRKLLNLRN